MKPSIQIPVTIFLATLLAACHGSGGSASDMDAAMPDATMPDAGTASPMTVGLSLVPSDYSRVRAATYDAHTGAVTLAAADIDDGAATPTKSTDAVPVRFGGTSGMLLRDLGQLAIAGEDGLTIVRRIDLNDAGETTPYAANPQAVVSVSSSKAYVTRLAKNTIVVIDPTKTGADARLRTIDLSGFALPTDTDGLVDAGAAIVIHNRAFVALGRYYIDGMTFSAVYPDTSLIAVIDTTTDTLVDTDPATPGTQGVTLEKRGPVALASTPAGALVVGSDGVFGENDGGVEVIDVDTFSKRTLVTEAALGGDIGGVVVSHSEVAAFVQFSSGMTLDGKLALVDGSSGVVTATPLSHGVTAVATAGADDLVVGLGTHLAVWDVGTGADVTPPGTPSTFDMALSLGGLAGY